MKKRIIIFIIFIICLLISYGIAHSDKLIFSDDFERANIGGDWITGADPGHSDTITIVGGRVQATDNGNYIETVGEFSGNLRIEMDVEMVGTKEHGCWDFAIALKDYYDYTGILRFDTSGVDGVALGKFIGANSICGDRVTIDGSAINKGKAIFTYQYETVMFSFENDDGDILDAGSIHAGNLNSSRIRIHLAAYPDSPRYVDNVKIYSTAAIQNPGNGHWYQRFDNTMTWHDAKDYCENLGGYLATINSQAEDDFVYDNLGAFSPHEYVWLGATDEAQEGTWKWVTGESWNFTNWDSGEPNNCSGIEHYLVYFTPNFHGNRPGLWNDLGEGDNGGCGCGGCINEWSPMSTICEWEWEEAPICNDQQVTIVGTEGHDVINGTAGPDVIHGLGGNDVILGLGGDDFICGGDGSDVIGAGSGNDIVLGEHGHDAIWGGPGNDTLRGGDGNDSIYGGPGNDNLHGNHGNDSLYGKSGDDMLYGGWGPNNGTLDNNDTCYDERWSFNWGCEVFYEQ